MFDEIYRNIQKKSPKERFLLVIAILFFIAYFVLGLCVIFMKSLPFEMKPNYRIAFGVLLIVYALIRFFRIINDNKE